RIATPAMASLFRFRRCHVVWRARGPAWASGLLIGVSAGSSVMVAECSGIWRPRDRYPGVEQDVDEVDQHAGDHDDGAGDHGDSEDDGVVAAADGIPGEEPKSRPGED